MNYALGLWPHGAFGVDTDGQLVWKETAETVHLARLRIGFLMLTDSASSNQLTGETSFSPVVSAIAN
jgi:hypothetical protein